MSTPALGYGEVTSYPQDSDHGRLGGWQARYA